MNNRHLLQQTIHKIFYVVTLLICFSVTSVYAASDSIIGYWKTTDDVSREPSAIIQIIEQDHVFSGKIIKLYNDPAALCSVCTGQKHNQPILGMTILSGFSQSGDSWNGGQLFAVRRGKAYDADLTLLSAGQQLQVNIKTGLGTRMQTWDRVQAP